MISPFAKAIVVVMLWLHRFIPSYGLVIIVFAILVKVVTWPLTTRSYRSIRAMQELQPDIQRIRERYKQDPQRMQAETMRLYRERKVNPMGGCLPILARTTSRSTKSRTRRSASSPKQIPTN